MNLYAVYLGGRGATDRLTEDHETVFVAATDVPNARAQARKKWSGSGLAHVDAVARISVVDGMSVSLRNSGQGDGVDEVEIDPEYEP
jgi:hypothetical protein